MNINERFNKERAKKLFVDNLPDNSFVEYCPKCNFQMHPEVHSLKFCPACKSGLVGIVLTKEMRILISGE